MFSEQQEHKGGMVYQTRHTNTLANFASRDHLSHRQPFLVEGDRSTPHLVFEQVMLLVAPFEEPSAPDTCIGLLYVILDVDVRVDQLISQRLAVPLPRIFTGD